MKTQKAKNVIETLLKQLSVTRTQLAAMLGVSERALSDWANKSLDEMTTEKAQRFHRLVDVVKYLSGKVSDKNHNAVRNILEDGRVPMSGVGDDDSLSLISYICASPGDLGWRANADAAMSEYLGFLRSREQRDAAIR